MIEYCKKTTIYKRWKDKGSKRNEIIGIFLLVLIFLLWCLISTINYNTDNKNIFKNYEITTGYLIRYSITGDFNNRILRYNYNVSGELIERYLTPDTYKYDYCVDDFDLCKGKKFHVVYLRTNPRISLIDLSHEIDKVDSVYVSRNLDKFE